MVAWHLPLMLWVSLMILICRIASHRIVQGGFVVGPADWMEGRSKVF